MGRAISERKSELLDAARDLIFSEGAGRFTMRRLAQRVGITEGAVYRHFASKEELLLALLARLFDRMRRGFAALARHAAPAPVRLRTLGRLHLALLLESRINPALLLSDAIDPEQASLRQVLARQLEFFRRLIGGIIRQGMREGSLSATLDAEAAVRCVLGLLQGAVIRWTIAGGAVGLRAQVDRSLCLLLAGFGAKPPFGQPLPLSSFGPSATERAAGGSMVARLPPSRGRRRGKKP
ncbi:MAG: Transcriptional regulator, TetR family [Candidatus Ozemobacter sibiricus]|jgi:AcrR family transcriptional regulator|uniref:Transcriptional regulator, TetR family n=1 Tax=Candidatus Ozemobacter sibiricus TaxID=2268124 RepID=A0A367ZMQ6_9BACT|nr:MAG: Transcriptional regulator, TetR family [Candidatus Ozemobacter sibiricus]